MPRNVLLLTLLAALFVPSAVNAGNVGSRWCIAAESVPSSLFASGPVVFNGRVWGFPGTPGSVSSTSDGATWYRTNSALPDAPSGFRIVVFNDRMWRLGGVGNTNVWYTRDGTHWTTATASVPWSARGSHSAVVFQNKVWVIGGLDAGGEKNDVWSSFDGVNWNRATANAEWSPRHQQATVVHDGKIWLLGGCTDSSNTTTNDVWVSSDGIHWTEKNHSAPWAPRSGHGAVSYNGRIWINGGGNTTASLSDMWSSADGLDWRQETAPDTAKWYFPYAGGFWGEITPGAGSPLVYNGNLWLIAGYTWVLSPDTTWRQVSAIPPWTPRYGRSTLSFGGKLWAMGGIIQRHDTQAETPSNAVFSSTNGSKWTTATASAAWEPRGFAGSLVFNNKMWVMGGSRYIWGGQGFNDVWYSSDGVKWDEALTSAPWGSRATMGTVVHNNKMWVIGGTTMRWSEDYSKTNFKNDVWSSSDGIKWDCVATTSPWSPRFDHRVLSFNGRIWVLGGYRAYGPLDESGVWSSADGKDWSTGSLPNGWDPVDFGATVTDGRMWLIGNTYADSTSFSPA